ncbi:MAG: GNAT family N-acetyltransferase [Halioglobus sp.]|nr:GNAT family N-acetyltransferase [Halioglobus sp.]
MADLHHHIRIEKVHLGQDGLDAPLQRAFSEYEARNPQYGRQWLENLTAHALDNCDQAILYIARSGPDNFVACPLKISSPHKRGSALSTFYTSSYCPIVNSEDPEDLFQALFRHLARTERISSLTLAPMAADTPEFRLMRDALSRAGWKGRHEFFCFGNWIHDIDAHSYQSYLASRPSKLRNTLARKTKKFLADDRGSLEIVQGGDKLEGAIERYVTVYNNSWKVEEPYPDFVPGLLRLAAARGWLRLGIASYDRQPVASQIWLVCERTAYIFKLAYHEDYKALSPGTVLTAHMMQWAIEEDGIDRIDYLSGDDAYKSDWMSVRREQHGLAAYNPRTPHGLVQLTAHTLKLLVKKLRPA